MNILKLVRPYLSGAPAVGLLLLRLVAGTGMALHGWQKFDNGWTSWMGDSLPGWLQGLAATAELGGGVFLLLGLVTQLVGIVLAIQMVAAYALVHAPASDPFVGSGSSYESAALYFAIAMLAVLAGPGKFSLDYALFGKDAARAHEKGFEQKRAA